MRAAAGWRLRELIAALACLALWGAPACRVGYELSAPDMGSGGSSGTTAGETTTGAMGGEPGGNSSMAGVGSDGGQTLGGSESTGGQAAEAGAPSLTEGGGGTSSGGSGGSAGGGGSPSCTDSADCRCASFEGHSYWFCSPAVTYDASSVACEARGMHLARVDSATENDFLLTTSTSAGLFALNGFVQIGANDLAVAGEWRWHDGTLFWQGGSDGSAVGGAYQAWDAASPTSQGTKNCAGILDTGVWQNRSCTALSPYICEAP